MFARLISFAKTCRKNRIGAKGDASGACSSACYHGLGTGETRLRSEGSSINEPKTRLDAAYSALRLVAGLALFDDRSTVAKMLER